MEMVREAAQWEREEMEKVVRDFSRSRICSWEWFCQACEPSGKCHQWSPHSSWCHGGLGAFSLCSAPLGHPSCFLALPRLPVYPFGGTLLLLTEFVFATCWYVLAKLQLWGKWPLSLEVLHLIHSPHDLPELLWAKMRTHSSKLSWIDTALLISHNFVLLTLRDHFTDSLGEFCISAHYFSPSQQSQVPQGLGFSTYPS